MWYAHSAYALKQHRTHMHIHCLLLWKLIFSRFIIHNQPFPNLPHQYLPVLNISCCVYTYMYRIAGNFRGVQFSRMVNLSLLTMDSWAQLHVHVHVWQFARGSQYAHLYSVHVYASKKYWQILIWQLQKQTAKLPKFPAARRSWVRFPVAALGFPLPAGLLMLGMSESQKNCL